MNRKRMLYRHPFLFAGMFLLLFLSSIRLSAQLEETFLRTYQDYQSRFYHYFIYETGDPMTQGSFLPIEYRKYRTDGKTVVYWADGVWWLGHYVAVLALEYERLKLTGQDTSTTIRRLYSALMTFKRLDLNAEFCWGDTTALPKPNGFYLRDDVSANMNKEYSAEFISSDYVRFCGKRETKGNAPSQDQAWACYMGLALVNKLVGDTTILRLSRETALALVTVMQHKQEKKETWEIVNPITGSGIQKKEDIQWLRYAHATMGTYLTGQEMTFGNAQSRFWKNMWKLLQNNFLIDKYGHFNWYGVMSISAVLNEVGGGKKNCYDWLVRSSARIVKKRPDLQQTLIFPHLPLVNVILHGYDGKQPLPAAAYESYLSTAPRDGAYRYPQQDTTFNSQPPWHSLSLFCPWQLRSEGEFNMLDYMLLYNAYWLVYKSGLPQYKKFFLINSR